MLMHKKLSRGKVEKRHRKFLTRKVFTSLNQNSDGDLLNIFVHIVGVVKIGEKTLRAQEKNNLIKCISYSVKAVLKLFQT